MLKTHAFRDRTITLCGIPRSRRPYIVDDDESLTCNPCRKKRGLPTAAIPTQTQLAEWRRDPGGAFDYGHIEALLRLLDVYKQQALFYEARCYQLEAAHGEGA